MLSDVLVWKHIYQCLSNIDGVSECVKHAEMNEMFLKIKFQEVLIKIWKLKKLKIFMKDVLKTLGELGGTFFGGTLGERGCVPPSSPGKKKPWFGGKSEP